jgi:glycosyltransferase involved in cell wall biosynthesis
MPSHDICFIGLKCYDYLRGTEMPRFVGGIERQLTVLANGLSQRGLRVAVVVYDHGQSTVCPAGSVLMFKSFNPDKGLRGVRFLHPRFTGLAAAMHRADAACYLQMGAGIETGSAAAITRGLLSPRRKFVFWVASDVDCDPHLPHLGPWLERASYRYGVQRADRVVVQTTHQQQMFRRAFGRDAEIIPTLLVEPGNENRMEIRHSPGNRIMWVGRISKEKRVEWLLETAARCPGYAFDLVGAPNRDSDYSRSVLDKAKRLPNVKVHGRVAETTLRSLFRDASLLCCTSTVEGFPVTFLEAWSHALPVISTVDPENLIRAHGLGRVCETLEDLVNSLHEFLGSPAARGDAANRASAYFRLNHSVEAVLPRVCQLINSLQTQ